MTNETFKQMAIAKTPHSNLRKTLMRSLCFLLTLLLIQNRADAQPPAPVETDTLAPFVTSTSVLAFTTTTATLSGRVTGDGGAAVTERGIVYSAANTLPTVGDTKVIMGSGLGVYSQTVTGLTGGTLYYVRAYATNIIGTSYGAVVSFTTDNVVPVVTTSEVSDITNTTATVGGNISFSGGAAVTERGVVYSTSNTSPTTADTKLVIGAGTGGFTGGLTGLVLGTTYYVRAYATNAVGTAYGAVFSFLPAGASVSTDAAAAITTNSVKVGGNVTSIGGSAVTDRGIVYTTGNGVPTVADNKVSIGTGAGVFSQTVASLQPATTYSVRAFATNSTSTGYGAVQTFTTQTTLVSINRANPSPTNLNIVNYVVSFAQSVTGVTTDNFAVASTGTITNSYVTAVTGSGMVWNVTVYTGKGEGTITLTVPNVNGIFPTVNTTVPVTAQAYTIDRTPPSFPLVSIRSNNADTTFARTGDNVTVTLVANETITAPSISLAGQTGVFTYTGSNNRWQAAFTMRTTDAEGPVAFTITGITDVAGNGIAAITATNNASKVIYDRSVPVLTSIRRVTASPTNATTVQFTITFAEPVYGVDATDFTLTTTLLTGASLTSFTGTGAVYTATVNTGSGNGTIRLDLNNTGTGITDLAGNPLTGGFTGGEVYTIAKVLSKPIVKTNDPAAVCATSTIDLTASAVTSGSDAGLTFAYYTDAAATIPLASPSAVAVSGVYYITGTNILNLTSDPVPVNVTVNNFQKPVAAFTFDSYCVNKAVAFTSTSAITGSGAVSYQWTDNNNHTSTAAAPSFTYAATGAYNVKLKVFSQLCPLVADSITQTITIAAPAAAIRMPTMRVIINDPNPLQARTNIGNTYLWAPSTGLSSATVSNPTLVLNQQTAYTVTITAASGCQTVDSLLVNLFEKYIYVPNIFSPNGDGINDVLYINLISVKQLRYFRIFNRYGKKVFETSDATIGWDGKLNGQLQPMDTYVWTAEGINKDGNQVTQQGNVTIVR